jgi:hypothetical protein
MRGEGSAALIEGDSARSPRSVERVESADQIADQTVDQAARSPYAVAQDQLAGLVDAAVHAQRVEAMQASMSVDVMFLALSHAIRAETAFVAPTLSASRRREMAHRSVVAELATALRIPERSMQRQVDEAWTLSTSLPATMAAMRAGDLTMQHARVIIEHAADVDDEHGVRSRLDGVRSDVATQGARAS